jgi:hypothetical protein
MLRTLLGNYAGNSMTTARVFTYTFAKLDSIINPVERLRLMIQLACKYTYDYRIDPAAFDEHVYQPFESVSHLAALEGAVTIVEDVPFENRQRASFLADFGTNAIERRYLPVVVLTYHAFLALLDLTQESRAWIDLGAPSTKDASRLRELREDILEFRLFHHLTYVSLLTMLNEFHHRLTRALGLELMLTIADRDVAEIGIWLDARLKQAETQRSAWFRRLTAASLAIISGATLGRILLETLASLSEHVAWIGGIAPWMHRIEPNSGVGPLVELFFAIVFGVLAWWWSEGGEVEKHVKDELTVHMWRDMDETASREH